MSRISGEALSWSLFAEGSRQGRFFGFAFFTADFLAPFFALLLESPAVCSAIRYGPMSSFLPLFLYSLMNYDRQDYFGRTVNIASRFQGLATSRSIFATRRVVTDSEASKLLQSNGIAATPEKRSLRGIAKQVEIFEIP